MDTHPLVQRWLQDVKDNDSTKDFPNYWSKAPKTLLTTSTLHGNIELGTGFDIYNKSILPAIETAEREVILVTCFWAQSQSLTAFGDVLRKLSTKSLQQGGRRIRVRICLSSLSLLQKLFHTNSLHGTTYSRSQWAVKFGLPTVYELRGLDLEIKSIFIRPFSVLHPKFVIVDRQLVLLPSCNVSWEDWFEGCVALSGDITGQFVKFWSHVWASESDSELLTPDNNGNAEASMDGLAALSSISSGSSPIQSIFLPSPHHVNPQFSFLPWTSCAPPPPTPLNSFLLAAIAHAQSNIYIQTPNLTSPPVLSALMSAVERGVEVEILTSERLMILEQVVTAGTTTARCIQKLVSSHKGLTESHRQAISTNQALLEEGLVTQPGRLKVSFYEPDESAMHVVDATDTEPLQSHLKLTVIDDAWTILGSGNMDRASWFTSQELGVAFFSRDYTRNVKTRVHEWMNSRKIEVYDSG